MEGDLSFSPYAFSGYSFSPISFGGLAHVSIEPTLRVSVPPKDFSGLVDGGYRAALAHTDFGATMLLPAFSGSAGSSDFSGIVSAMSGYQVDAKAFAIIPGSGEFSGDVAAMQASSLPASSGIVVDLKPFAQVDSVRSFSIYS